MSEVPSGTSLFSSNAYHNGVGMYTHLNDIAYCTRMWLIAAKARFMLHRTKLRLKR